MRLSKVASITLLAICVPFSCTLAYADFQGQWHCSAAAFTHSPQAGTEPLSCIVYTGKARSNEYVDPYQITAECHRHESCYNPNCTDNLPYVECTGTVQGTPEEQTASGWAQYNTGDYWYIPFGTPIDPPPTPMAACSAQSETINYGDISPSEFNGATRIVNVPIKCDSEATIDVSTSPSVLNFSNGGSASVSVTGGGKGIAVPTGETVNVQITSVLSGSNVDVGPFSAAATLVLTPE